MNKSLREIFYSLDPSVDGASVKYNNYLSIYEDHLEKLRDYPVNMLEIGIEKGGSLSMWSKYFPKSTIVGLDIVPGCKKHERGNIKVRIGDQMDADFLKKVGAEDGPFDIIIDDGGHFTSQHLSCFNNLIGYVNNYGLYIIEDLHTCYMPQFTENNPDTIMNFCQNLAALPTINNGSRVRAVHFYKNIVVVQKGLPEGDKVTSPGFEQVPYPQ